MKRRLSAFLLFAAVFFSVSLAAREGYTVKTVPATEILQNSYVTDLSELLTAGQKAEINASCRFAKDSLGAEIAVVILPGIDTGVYGSLHEFGTELYNTWKIGDSGTERGLLILFVTDPSEREIAFVTGYGMEGVLPDVYCKRIQADVMVPLMKEGRYAEGLLEGVKTASSIISGDVVMPETDGGDGAEAAFIFLGIVLLGGLLLALTVAIEKKRRIRQMGRELVCSCCAEKGNMKYSRYVIMKHPTRRTPGTGRYYYICRSCGAENFREVVIPRSHDDSDITGPMVAGGHFGGFGGGSRGGGFGGFGGGSFGGGFSGGGGASTRF